MNRPLRPRLKFTTLVFLMVAVLSPASTFAAQTEVDTVVDDADGHDRIGHSAAVPTFNHAETRAGYGFVNPADRAVNAAPYLRLRSGATGSASAATVGSDLKLTADAIFMNVDDYHSEMLLDYRGVYRLHLESQSLWHNLPSERLPPGSAGIYTSTNLSPSAGYGLRAAVTQAEGRIRPGSHPFHLILGYWQLDREGTGQAIFSDHYFADPLSRILSSGKRIDNATREGTAAVDGYFGYFGLSYAFRIRDFANSAPDSRYGFSSSAGGTLVPGNQAYGVISDSRLTSHTIKLYSDLSGGLVGTGAYTITRRENMVDRGDARPSGRPTDTQQLVSGDISYTPFKELVFAIKYRRLDMNSESPAAISYSYAPGSPAAPGILPVRPSVETVRDTLSFSTAYRPVPAASINLEYRAELESRNNVPDPLAPDSPAAFNSDRRQTHTGKASFSWRPYKGIKVNGSYSYAACDNPAYAASFSDSHNAHLFVSYAANGTWGANAGFIGRYESGENPSAAGAALARDSRNNSANAGFWFSPLERLVLTANYSYLNTDSDQAMFFSKSAGSLAATSYRSGAHLYAAGAVYSPAEALDLSLAFQRVHSSSRFLVPPVQDVSIATEGIAGLTGLDSVETGVSTRVDWRITGNFGLTADYSFRNYDVGNPVLDGLVHSTQLSLTAKW